MSCFMENVQFIKIVPKVAQNGINDIIIISDDNNVGDSVKIVFDNLLPRKNELIDTIENDTFTALALNQETGEIIGEATVLGRALHYFCVDKEAEGVDLNKLRETLFEYVIHSGKVSYVVLYEDMEPELLELCKSHKWDTDKNLMILTK